jgi:hypothetical protein
MLDLEGLAILADDYEAANMPYEAAELWRSLKYSREKERLVNCGKAGFGKIMGNQAG